MKKIFFLLVPVLISACATGDNDADTSFPEPLGYEQVFTGGELGKRLEMNFNRMEEAKYRPDSVFLTNEESHWWPGDTEGRTVLALTHLAQSTGRTPQFLEEILESFPDHFNPNGYFGDIASAGVLDEQQLSSHGWVLRGLCEYYEWKQDESVMDMIRGMVEGFVLPTAGLHYSYPVDPEAREKGKGSYIGSRNFKMLNNWILSTDIGCDFIFLDGVIHAYDVTGDERLKPLIEEMIGVYLSIDLEAIHAQTHATLTGIRALLRYFSLTGKGELLEAAVQLFEIYKGTGISENYENYNWFGRPTHTEPCAIHDSYMVAKQLWQYTGNSAYLEDAEHIYYNGIGSTQRSNGGFGCNSCSGAANHFLEMKIFEAHWCCTMRGGEGLSYAAKTAAYAKDKDLFITSYGNKQLSLGDEGASLILKLRSGYPFEGELELEIQESSMDDLPVVHIFAPTYLENYRLELNGELQEVIHDKGFISLMDLEKGDRVRLLFDPVFRSVEAMNPNSLESIVSFRAGPLVLTSAGLKGNSPLEIDQRAQIEYSGESSYTINGHPFIPAYHLMDPRMDDPEISRQIVF